MPNRIIKESICSSENVDQLSAFHETFFYRLIVNCDDFGRMDARPKILASRLFPLKDIRTNQVEDALRALTSAELVTLYEVDGKPFLQMNTWDKHQQVRAKKSKYPSPDEGIKASASNCEQMIADDSKCPRNPIQSNPNPNPNTKGRFTPPTLEEVSAYCKERNNGINAQYFIDYYSARGWELKPGQKVKDWKACVRTWEEREKKESANNVRTIPVNPAQNYSQRSYADEKTEDEKAMEAMARLQAMFGEGVSG